MSSFRSPTKKNEKGLKVQFENVDWAEEGGRTFHGFARRKWKQQEANNRKEFRREDMVRTRLCLLLLKSPNAAHIEKLLRIYKREKLFHDNDNWYDISSFVYCMERLFKHAGVFVDGKPRKVTNFETALAWFRRQKKLEFNKEFLKQRHLCRVVWEISTDEDFNEEFPLEEHKKMKPIVEKIRQLSEKMRHFPPPFVGRLSSVELDRLRHCFDSLKSDDQSSVKWWVSIMKEAAPFMHDFDNNCSRLSAATNAQCTLAASIEKFLRSVHLPETIVEVEDKLLWFRQEQSITFSEQLFKIDEACKMLCVFCMDELFMQQFCNVPQRVDKPNCGAKDASDDDWDELTLLDASQEDTQPMQQPLDCEDEVPCPVESSHGAAGDEGGPRNAKSSG